MIYSLFCFGQVMSATIIAPLSIALIVLLGWHVYLLLNNKTTIEVLNCIYHVKFISEVFQWNRNLKIFVFVFCRNYACHVFVHICLLKKIVHAVWRFYGALHFSLHNVNFFFWVSYAFDLPDFLYCVHGNFSNFMCFCFIFS